MWWRLAGKKAGNGIDCARPAATTSAELPARDAPSVEPSGATVTHTEYDSTMTRRVRTIAIFLLLGAVANVGARIRW